MAPLRGDVDRAVDGAKTELVVVVDDVAARLLERQDQRQRRLLAERALDDHPHVVVHPGAATDDRGGELFEQRGVLRGR